MKGIILAGGSGTRLYPLTTVISKQLLPLYDKPMIYYPLSTLMLADIREILIITTSEDIGNFKKLLGDGSQFGVEFTYAVQPKPEGLAQALIIGEEFVDKKPCALILGDNIFYGSGLGRILEKATADAERGKATIFGYHVHDPERYGIIEFDKGRNVVSIEEKPKKPKSNYCVTGLYFYDGRASEFAKTIKPSERGELEITDLNNIYLRESDLCVELLDYGFSWMDSGTFDSMLRAANYVHILSEQQNTWICVPEEIAYKKKWIDKKNLLASAKKYGKSDYGRHLRDVAESNHGEVHF